ncbi:hypothetical protein ACFPIJ_41650 [Dactylosporangium cerinum]|uniref:Cytochrome P450 n=1 Tax=Dactylosporangium cerinum TaxID=1434730 RepID=A0ABV9W8I1_9ACTN
MQQLLQLRELRTPGADFLALQGITEGLLVDTMHGFLLNTDGDDHARVRRLVSGAFTTRRVEAFRPVVARIAAELVSALAATGRRHLPCRAARDPDLRDLDKKRRRVQVNDAFGPARGGSATSPSGTSASTRRASVPGR